MPSECGDCACSVKKYGREFDKNDIENIEKIAKALKVDIYKIIKAKDLLDKNEIVLNRKKEIKNEIKRLNKNLNDDKEQINKLKKELNNYV